MKLIVVSICKDESETIGKVLDFIPKHIEGIKSIEKIVIDDGSTDNTVKIAKDHGAEVYSDGVQKRLAFRFKQAIDLALEKEADCVVNIDGDLQFNPKDIPKLLGPILSGDADFVAADRFTKDGNNNSFRPNGMPASKYFGNKIGAFIVSNMSGQRFNDVTCGFRAYNRDALFALNINGNYTYTQESFQVLALKKLRIKTVPVVVKYYDGRQSRVVQSIIKFIASSATNILRSYRDYQPLNFFGTLGALLAVPGLILGTFVIVRWFSVGQISPYKAVGLIGLYLFTLGIIVWVLGIVADMLDRLLNNQEKILEISKRIRYDKKNK